MGAGRRRRALDRRRRRALAALLFVDHGGGAVAACRPHATGLWPLVPSLFAALDVRLRHEGELWAQQEYVSHRLAARFAKERRGRDERSDHGLRLASAASGARCKRSIEGNAEMVREATL